MPRRTTNSLCRYCGASTSTYSGDYIASVRLKAGLTLREVADRARCSIGYVHDMEDGRRKVTDSVARALSLPWPPA